MKLRALPAALAGLVALTASALAAPFPPDAAAVVNGVAISRKALLDVVQSLISQLDDIPDPPTTERYRREALDSLIDFELLYQDGVARQLSVSPTDVGDEMKRTEKSFPTRQDYQDALKAKGLTQKDIEVETRRALMVNRVLKDVVWPGVATPDDAIRSYYDKHQAEFTHPPQVRAGYILIRTKKGASAAERTASRAKADGLLQRARNGEDFAGLATSTSDDPATAQRGGDLGYISRGIMGDAFDQVAFGIEPGQTSDVVETPFGFMIIKVVSRREGGVAPLEEVRERIANGIRDEGRAKAQAEFVKELRAKAKIEVSPDLR